MSSDIAVQVREAFENLVSADTVGRIAKGALTVASRQADVGLSVVIADDEAVRDLNRRHRGLDETTDVLAFSFAHSGEYYGDARGRDAHPGDIEFPLPPGEADSLGEVIVSYPQARRQAEGAGHTVERELALLVTHGVLHLLGHDHEAPEEEAVMRRMAAEALAGLEEQG